MSEGQHSAHFEIDVVEDPIALLQIVSTCHQRACRIVSLDYVWTSRIAHISLGVCGDESRTGRLGLVLSGLVRVLEVRELGSSVASRLGTSDGSQSEAVLVTARVMD